MESPLLSKNEIKFSISESFTIKGNNDNNIRLKISYNEKIIFFEAEEENVFPKQEFNLYQSLEQLTKIDRYFRQFDELKEVFEFIKTIISKNNLSVVKEENRMKLKLSNPLINKDIIINLTLKAKDIKSEVESLIPYINSLNKKIDSLENQIKDMKIEFKNQIKDMKIEFENKIKDMKAELDEIKNKFENKIPNLFQGSQIIDDNDKNLIMSWFDKKIISTELLLNAEINDNFLQAFFSKCINRKNTMIFIRTTDNLRFGGFTSVIWPTNGNSSDKESFVFSLTNRQKYKILNADRALEVFEGSWISFGPGMDLYLHNRLKTIGGATIKSSYDIPSNKNGFYLNGGKDNFKLSNCEIYQINF